MFAPVGCGQQVVTAGGPSSTRNGSRSEIRLNKCKGWEHTHIFVLVGRGQQVVAASSPPGGLILHLVDEHVSFMNKTENSQLWTHKPCKSAYQISVKDDQKISIHVASLLAKVCQLVLPYELLSVLAALATSATMGPLVASVGRNTNWPLPFLGSKAWTCSK